MHAVSDIVLNLSTPFLESSRPKRFSIPARAPVINLETRKTSVCEKLHNRVEPPFTARAGATMRIDDDRYFRAFHRWRQGQVTVYLPTIARLIGDGLHFRKQTIPQFRAIVG